MADFTGSADNFKAKYGMVQPEAGGTIIFHCNGGHCSGNFLKKLETEHADLFQKYSFTHFAAGVKGWN